MIVRARSARSARNRTVPRPRQGGLIAALAAIVLVAAVATFTSADNDIPGEGWQVTPTSPTANLVDGQLVTLNVKSRIDVGIQNIEIRQCRAGVTYATEADMSPTAGNCPATPISSTAPEHVVVRDHTQGLKKLAQSDAGATIPYQIGAGVAEWDSPSGKKTLTCGPADPCLLVVRLRVGQETRFWTRDLTFGEDPLATCGGVQDAVIATAGPDELSDAWADWTRDYCSANGPGAPTRIAFPGEGEALSGVGGNGGFAEPDEDGAYSYDLAYSASGYNEAVGLVSKIDASERRRIVAVPVAVNAAVLAAGNGFLQLVEGQPIGDKAPYPPLEVKAPEAAAMLSGGITRLGSSNFPYAAGVLTRNPILGSALYMNNSAINAPSLALTSTWMSTSYLAKLAPDDFVAPRENPQVKRQPTARLATADPGYHPQDVSTYTGRPVLYKTTQAAALGGMPGPLWVFSDYATSMAIGLSPVALENADHQFVAPTPASLAAAVALMTPDENGLLEGNPEMVKPAGSAAESATPYPLTYVVYALVPAEPLVDTEDCTLRSASQSLLTKWLDYLVGDGQKELTGGLQPLPAALVEQAKAAIPTIGTATVTGVCAGKVTIPMANNGGGNNSGAGNSFLPTTPTPTIPSFSSSNFPTNTLPAGPPVTVAGTTTTRPGVEIAAVPAFAGRERPGAIDGVVALLGIALVTSLALSITARASAGRRPRVASGSGGYYQPAAQQRLVGLGALWVGVLLAGAGLVVYQLAPFLQNRSQHDLLVNYRGTLRSAAFATEGIQKESNEAERAPTVGSSVGILEIGALRSQNVVAEGADAAQTREGPGHVPGTSGLGQPGNSVVVARRNSYGGPFANLGILERGSEIVVSTVQGRSVYAVKSVRDLRVADGSANGKDGEISRDRLFGNTEDDQLTLVTSSSPVPWNATNATVVVAEMQGTPFPATVQGALTDDEMTISADGSAVPAIVLALLLYAAAMVGSIIVYRRFRFRVAYALTIAPIIAVTVIVGETASHLLPSWA